MEEEIIKHCFELYKNRRYKIISDRMLEVDDKIVTKKIKKGRTILTCSCQNHGRFPNESLCRHKSFFMLFPSFEHYDKKIKELIDFLNINKNLPKKNRLDVDGIIMLLEDLKRVK